MAQSRIFWNRLFKIIVIILALCLAFELLARAIVEIIWFQEVNYLYTLLQRWQSEFFLCFFTTTISSLYLFGNLRIANRFKWPNLAAEKSNSFVVTNPTVFSSKAEENALRSRLRAIFAEEPTEPKSEINFKSGSSALIPQSPSIKLSILLPIVLSFYLLIALMVIYYSKVALEVWQPDWNLPKITPSIPSAFAFFSAQKLLQEIYKYLPELIIFISILFGLLFRAQLFLNAITVLLSLIFGLILAGNWATFLLYINSTFFNKLDPQFNADISFYVFKLPLWDLIYFWLSGLFLYALISCCIIYLVSARSLSEGKFPGFSRWQLRHLCAIGGKGMLTLTLHHWLQRYELVYSKRGVTYGANYTDLKIGLPLEIVLGSLAAAIAFWLFFKAATGFKTNQIRLKKINKIPLSLVLIFSYLSFWIFGNIAAYVVQRLVVQPNELAREQIYLTRNIAMTRAAFALDEIEAKTFDPEGKLNAAKLQKNSLTINNIRLWDTNPLLKTNQQLQQIRLYYKFVDADIDRYNLKLRSENRGNTQCSPDKINCENGDLNEKKNALPKAIVTEKQQVIIAPRELDYSGVPKSAQTWVNEHLVYTHGYGFTLSPVNKVDKGGLPYYFVKDIGSDTYEGDLNTSSQLIRDSLPIGKPRIYYGELTNTYIMTSTKVKELDFPSGEDNVYNIYDGKGGIKIDNYFLRAIFAQYLKDWRMLFTQNFTPNTRILIRRNINRRIRTLAPFLYYDRDPYLVVADTQTGAVGQNHLYWVVDAYTTSDRYPYSDPGENKFNYIRNSVKVIIDAYNGDVDFYIANPEDPIVQSWKTIFPELFKPIEAMSPSLRIHIRYPEDLFNTQSERLLTYHMTDPKVFYNREDQWQIPKELYGQESRSVSPYYLIMKLPTEISEEFILLHPYTPVSRPNMIAWLAARSDGQQYGKLLLYKFPKEKLVYGPDQIEALINQDPGISQRISLWNQKGSRAIQGNLLAIPIEQSLLYVEPLYLEAEQNSLPTLARVIVVYENKIVMADSLQEGLDAIFKEVRDTDSPVKNQEAILDNSG